jgi:hypothetical protein
MSFVPPSQQIYITSTHGRACIEGSYSLALCEKLHITPFTMHMAQEAKLWDLGDVLHSHLRSILSINRYHGV